MFSNNLMCWLSEQKMDTHEQTQLGSSSCSQFPIHFIVWVYRCPRQWGGGLTGVDIRTFVFGMALEYWSHSSVCHRLLHNCDLPWPVALEVVGYWGRGWFLQACLGGGAANTYPPKTLSVLCKRARCRQ